MSDAIVSKYNLPCPEGSRPSGEVHMDVSRITRSPKYGQHISEALVQSIRDGSPEGIPKKPISKEVQKGEVRGEQGEEKTQSDWVRYINWHADKKISERKRAEFFASGESSVGLGDWEGAALISIGSATSEASLLDQPGMDYVTFEKVELKQKKVSRLMAFFKQYFCCKEKHV